MKKAIHVALVLALASVFGGSIAREESDSVYRQEVKAREVFRTSTTSAGQPIRYPKTESPEVTMLQVTIPPGKETGWHRHPVPGYAYILSGRLTVETEGGNQNTFEAGQGYAEVVAVAHNGKNSGTVPVELIVVFTGEKNSPFTVK